MLNGSQLIEPVRLIVLTGGPCSGKSSSLAYLSEKLSDHGFMVFVVPETATLITASGIDRRKMHSMNQVVLYEEAILDMQLSFEETYAKAVGRIFPERKKVMLLDRGVMDIKAFIPKDAFNELVKRKGLKEVNLRDRYHGVVHLVTAAEGALAYYTAENNGARIETPEEAVRIDRTIRESWLGHPHFKIIDNRSDFEGKMRRTFMAISRLLGIPSPSAVKEKFIVREVRYDALPAHQTIEVEQVFLRTKNRDEEIRIRKRVQEDCCLYFLTRRRKTAFPVDEEEVIDEQQYVTLKKLIDPKTDVLGKERICFLWEDQHFELDSYRGRHEGLSVLVVEPLEGEETGVRIPPFISVEKNITNNHRYSERNMAARKKRPAVA